MSATTPPVVTQRDTFDAFVGSGALSYSWYESVSIVGPEHAHDLPASAYDGWRLTFADEDRTSYTVDHASIMRAANTIARGGVKYAGSETVRNCRILAWPGNGRARMDELDFDSVTADNVIQFAAFGEIIYG